MDIKLIKSQHDYERSLARVESLMDATEGSQALEELEVLSTLVNAYEENHFPIDAPNPIEFIKNVMEFRGTSQSEFAALLNSRSRAAEILGKKRKLSLSHIRAISGAWGVPTEPLIQDYSLENQ